MRNQFICMRTFFPHAIKEPHRDAFTGAVSPYGAKVEMDEEITEIDYTELHEHFRPHSFLRVGK